MNIKKDVKEPTTIEQQIEILKSRNLIIEDEDKAKSILYSANYYSFTGYLFDFKDANGNYINTTFEKAYNTYLCDKRFKSIILYAMEIIEHNIKTKFAYVMAHNYGSLSYRDKNNFIDEAKHKKTMNIFEEAVYRNRNLAFVKHHQINYKDFPMWVAIELFTFGNTCKFYCNLNKPIKKLIAKEFNTGYIYLESWLKCLVYLRNMCAHYMKLYNVNIPTTPKLCKNNFKNFTITNKIFDIIYVMKLLMPDASEWNNYIIPNIEQIFEEYKDYIEITNYGFPENWVKLLTK